MTIYLDAMGGDNAPEQIINGAILACEEYNQNITLIGDEKIISAFLDLQKYSSDKLQILNATENIAMDEEPVKAVRQKKDSPIVVGAMKAAQDTSGAFISAGSTGAVLTAGMLYCKRIKDVKRPALATVLPGKAPTLLVDNGANAECRADYFVQFAQMGAAYMKALFPNSKGRIGLLNIGTEETKGNALYKEAYKLLSEDESINFIGNVEPKSIFETQADVVVCDGFTGNILLKGAEGSFKFVLSLLKEVFANSFIGKLAYLGIKKEFSNKRRLIDPSSYGGVPLLGINGNIIKAHGSSDALAIKNAVHQAILMTENNILGKIEELL